MPRSAVTSPPKPPRALHPDLQRIILGWYAAQGRQLAFRATSDPYAILVSEAMAQQTQGVAPSTTSQFAGTREGGRSDSYHVLAALCVIGGACGGETIEVILA